MTPPTQPKKCVASSNGAPGVSLSASLNRNSPMEILDSQSIQNVKKLVRWAVELSDGCVRKRRGEVAKRKIYIEERQAKAIELGLDWVSESRM